MQEVGLASYSVYSCHLIVADADGYANAAFKGQNRSVFKSSPTEYALVVHHCSVLSEFRSYGSVSLVGFTDFSYGSNGHLRGKLVPVSGFSIYDGLEFHLVSGVVLVGKSSDVVAGFVEAVHGLLQCFKLFLSCVQFDEKCLLHNREYNHQCLKRSSQFLPPLKGVGFLGSIGDSLYDICLHDGKSADLILSRVLVDV